MARPARPLDGAIDAPLEVMAASNSNALSCGMRAGLAVGLRPVSACAATGSTETRRCFKYFAMGAVFRHIFDLRLRR